MFIKGVNIGSALPGKWFTEFPRNESIYLNWFDLIGKMNANELRFLVPEYQARLKESYYALQEYFSELE